MSAPPPVLRTLAFGDPELTAWGAGWILGSGGETVTVLGAGDRAEIAPDVQLLAQDGGDEWRLEGGGATLLVAPAADGVAVSTRGDEIAGHEQLCRITGRFALDGAEHAIDCLGLSTWWSGPTNLDAYESIRAVASWFHDPDEALGLVAFRARKARAHDADAAAAAVVGGEGATAVDDPRLSTTYEAEGWPVRAGLELWPPVSQDGEQPFPRRASGEAIGARAQAASGGLDLRFEPLRWHSRGRKGAGMYILARRS